MNYENFEEEEVEELEGCTSLISPPVAHAAFNSIKGLNISWVKFRGGNILLNASNFSFPSMTFQNVLSIWFCGDISKKNPPYIILRCKDVKQVRGGKNLSNM